MSTHLTEEEIAYAAEMQSAGNYKQLPSAIKQHLAECDLCANEVLVVNELIADESKKKGTSKVIKIFTFAAVAASILIIFTLNFFVDQQPETEKQVYAEKQAGEKNRLDTTEGEKAFDSQRLKKSQSEQKIAQKNIKTNQQKPKTKKAVSRNLYAQAFTPNSQLEQLVERTQSGHMRSTEQIEMPVNINYPKQKTVHLNVEPDQNYTIALYNNQNKLISEFVTDTLHLRLPPLDTGLYYWKLINDDFDLIFVGRIKAFEPEK